jgi:FkbM family methyltransferase
MNLRLAAPHISPAKVLDIGANVGYWYKEAREIWPEAYFFLIEANEECRPELEKLNVPFRIAVLSDTNKEVEFFTMKDCGTATGCSYYRENTPFFQGDRAVGHKVRTKTLDEIAALIDLRFPLLIKLDCQGAELDILKGGGETMRAADAIIIEVAHADYNIGAPQAVEVVAYLTAHGFIAREKLEDVCHPLQRDLIIQTTMLFTR